jgi:predicted ester cyclase
MLDRSRKGAGIDRRTVIAAVTTAPFQAALPSSARSESRAMRNFISDHPRARALIRIGEEAIARENPAMLRAYFAEDFVFHGPGGDLTFTQLSDYFTSLRAAFTDFRLTREQIVVDGDHAAARNVFSGIFTNVFTQSPVGPLPPTGKPVRWEAINIFRFDGNGRLGEEWVQSDQRGLLGNLGGLPG